MNVARSYAFAAIVNGYIYVAGGRKSENTTLSVVECYNPMSDEWVQVAPMNWSRSSSALIKSNGFLYALGGNRAIERYDPRNICWKEVCAFMLLLIEFPANLYRLSDCIF